MRITDIRVILLQRTLSSSMHISRGGFSVRNHAIIEVHTDSGITGLGEGIGDAQLVRSIIETRLKPLAIGLDPMNIETLRRKLMDSQVYFERKGSAICAASGIEMACWDIMGKALDVPVYQLLGGLYRDTLDAYVSDIYWEEDGKAMARNAERILAMGYTAIKVHIGCDSPRADYERLRLVRKVAGDDIKLMVDVNAGYDSVQAREAARRWADLDLYWLEEPVLPDQIDTLADLRRFAGMAVAAGENEFRLHGFKELFEKRAIDVAMPDIGRAGGIQETRNICALADAFGIMVSPHNFSSGVLLAATIHLMASTPCTSLLELDSSQNAVYQELLLEPLTISGGKVRVPAHPGLGVEIRPETVKKYAINV
jgi:L-alanine-DL-glutamate epimerase-like enolase superfamily enzyme